ncbi:hypothetical protein FR483_N357R [Paramecium bursaria Chlorella virus FR483]|uniref:Uncharacterized protein N357R n=1 Tax=Paramecium bursaria Chlorella virus FR483 TaxID=399781 RepID=A7J761_PBCVF|nr:hypothetical protein FR483_N357R [Paramecium bursaria Chlorella virus FR483]ABT15642.1 hypothetical protein FR483_N357R [Paramecium bursaria Chlorella virus FR483]
MLGELKLIRVKPESNRQSDHATGSELPVLFKLSDAKIFCRAIKKRGIHKIAFLRGSNLHDTCHIIPDLVEHILIFRLNGNLGDVASNVVGQSGEHVCLFFLVIY